MPLPVPVLDDRTWDELRSELVRRIAAYAPEWTDRGASDPGVTILELVAFLGENLLFRFNQIPDATQLQLLRLLHVPLRAATPARGLVTFSVAGPAAAVVEGGLTEARAGDLRFTIEDDVDVLPVAVRGALKTHVKKLTDEEQRLVAERRIDARDGLASGEQPRFYRTELIADDDTAATDAPRDIAATVDGSLWIAVLAPDAGKVAGLIAANGPLGTDPAGSGRGAIISLAVALPRTTVTVEEVDACFGDNVSPQGPPPQVEWRISTPHLDDDGEPEYLELDTVSDTTRGLTTDGVVRLQLPTGLAGVAWAPDPDPDRAGTGQQPPPLDDEERPILFWIRAFPPPGAPQLGRVQWVGVNGARAVQAVKASAEYLGTGTGMPNQRYRLVHGDVLDRSLVVDVEEQGQWVKWTEVETFAASRPSDRHYTLDAEAGAVTFGDTLRGLAPQRDQRIRAREYWTGGGSAGSVATDAIAKVELVSGIGTPTASIVTAAGARVRNPLPLSGGADAETIAEGLARIPGELRRRDRAVTASDFRELARATPGGGVGRAECLPLFHPHQRTIRAAGVVTVVVWPREDPINPDAPQPDRGLLNAVCRFLDARRLVTTELYVIPPTYRSIAVSVGVEVKPGASPDAVRRWVERVIRQYLSPLPPFGPDGEGWPLGRAVRAAELEAAALQVEGVLYLRGLEVATPGPSGAWVRGTVTLDPWEVVEVSAVTVVAGDDPPPPGEGIEPPDDGVRTVPIPVPPDVC